MNRRVYDQAVQFFTLPGSQNQFVRPRSGRVAGFVEASFLRGYVHAVEQIVSGQDAKLPGGHTAAGFAFEPVTAQFKIMILMSAAQLVQIVFQSQRFSRLSSSVKYPGIGWTIRRPNNCIGHYK
jgi:hypothetical protein